MTSGAPWRVISPASPGKFDGIGDFSAMLTDALQPFGRAELFVRAHTWQEIERVDVEDTAGAIVQYLPQAFMRGDLRLLLRWLDRLRAQRRPVILMVHEYWPPLDGTIRRAAIRMLFRRMLRACLRRSTAMVTSQEFSAHELTMFAPSRQITAIPVGSSIPVPAVRVPPASGCPLVLFGQPAALHAPTMAAIGRWLATAPSDVSLTWLGRSTEEMRERWCEAWRLPTDRVTFAGGLPAADVSAVLAAARIGLAPYENGASTRRTTLAAMLGHQLPVVAVDGLYTSDWLRASGASVWTPEGSPAMFVAGLSALMGDNARQHALSLRAGELFTARLAWPRIGEAYARLLLEGGSL